MTTLGRIIEGLWDCKYCDTKEIKGRIRECPNCGKPRDEDTRFYLPANKQQFNYLNEEEATQVTREPDWLCEFCDSLNSAKNTHCESCGAERTAENLDYFSNIAKMEAKKQSHSEDCEDEETSTYNYVENSYYSSNTKRKETNFFSKNWKLFAIVPLIISVVIGAICLIFIPREENITINDIRWERSISIERYKTVEESDWSVPSGGRILYTQQEIAGYEEVFDHYETYSKEVKKERLVGYEDYVVGYQDLGNGYFEEIIDQRPVYETYYETEDYTEAVYRDEPIYKTKYYYEIERWVYERSVKTSGADKNPYWGELNLNSDERESSRTEYYYIAYINEKGKKKELSLKYEQWKELEVGDTVKIKKSLFGTGEVIT